MEPQVNVNCCMRRSNNSCCCLSIIITIFALLLVFALGVLIGGVTGLFALIGVGAFIVLLTLLAVTLIALIIYYLCRNCRRRSFCR